MAIVPHPKAQRPTERGKTAVDERPLTRHLQQDFSLVLGGPFYQLLRRTHLSGSALEQLRGRTLTAVAVTWLPLLLLALASGEALGGKAGLPFLYDVEVHVRFLAALPLLIVAELIVHQRMRLVVRRFIERRLIPDAALPRFDEAIAAAFRLRNAFAPELVFVAFVYLVGVMIVWRHGIALSTTATWYGMPSPTGMQLTSPGIWYVFVSLSIFQFLLLRWYFRLFIWTRFLWQVSRINLTLMPTHPDRVGGLGFLANIAYAFVPLATAHGIMLAGPVANRILYVGAKLPQFKAEIAMLVAWLCVVVFGPFLVFAPQLASAKRLGLGEYGTLAERYVREFDAKWVRGGASAGEPLLGSSDVQSLADMANSFDVVKRMQIAPITRDAFLGLAVATLAPIAPLALTMMSFEDLVRKLLAMLF
jgi:hypothetical protein